MAEETKPAEPEKPVEEDKKPEAASEKTEGKKRVKREKKEKPKEPEGDGDDSKTLFKNDEAVFAYHGPMLYPARVSAKIGFQLFLFPAFIVVQWFV